MNALAPTPRGEPIATNSILPVRVWNGEQIIEPGIYAGVPNEIYHRKADLCDGPSISSGGLRKIDSKNPAYYWDTSPYNPDPDEDKDADSEALLFGRACHTLLLGEEGFKDQYWIRPDHYPSDESKAWNANANDCKRWLAEAALAGKDVLTKAQVKRIAGMAASLAAHPTIMQAGILRGQVERSIFWRDRKTGVWLKARPDCLPEDDNTVSDLKSCASAHPVDVRRAISDHGYHQQFALIDEGIRETTGRQMQDHLVVFVESKRPHCINIKPLTPEAIADGYRQNRRAIDKFAEGMKTGYWPGYDDDDEVPADLTDQLRNRLKREAEAGLLPEVA